MNSSLINDRYFRGAAHPALNMTNLNAFNVENAGKTPHQPVIGSTYVSNIKTRYLIVDSNSRDISKYPQPNYYRITFDPIYLIKSIKIVAGTMPDVNNITDEPYLIINLDEFNNLESSNTNVHNAFTLLQLQPAVVAGKFINTENTISNATTKYFNPPLEKLSQLTLSIRDLDNILFDFGDDSGGPDKSLQNFFLFEIVTE